ncbi:MAG: glycosyltransferase family 2 protein [Paracoccaceae bacterium]
MQTAAALTMVRDDAFFLKAWLRHYGALFGRENCYIVNHGRGSLVADLAAGCNVIGIPGDPHRNFDVKRWGMLNGFVDGLRKYYRHVIVGDVDELIVVDPQTGQTLLDWLKAAKGGQVYTPLGLEVIHRPNLESDTADRQILGPRRYVRTAAHYAKPGIVSTATKLSRGGHYAKQPDLLSPPELYLFHLKFCDFANYCGVMDQRNALAESVGAGHKNPSIGKHWFSAERGADREVFDAFAKIPHRAGFDLSWMRDHMHATWGPRGDTGYFNFDMNKVDVVQYTLPERFFGLF